MSKTKLSSDTPVRVKVLHHFPFNRLRRPGEVFELPTQRWADFFCGRGLAVVTEEPLSEGAKKLARKPRASSPKRSETDRTPKRLVAEAGPLLTG